MDLEKFPARLSSRKDQKGLMKGEVLDSQAFVLEAALTISLKKVTSEVKFAERKSVLLQNKIGLKKLCLLFSYKVTLPLHLPIKKFMSK